MILLEVLLVVALVAAAVYVLLGRRARPAGWTVATRTERDGSLVVAVRAPDGGERVVRELPPGLTGVELTSELRLAHEEAEDQAAELNRSSEPRTRRT